MTQKIIHDEDHHQKTDFTVHGRVESRRGQHSEAKGRSVKRWSGW